MMDHCITCRGNIPVDRVYGRKTLQRHVPKTNVKVGNALHDMGIEVGTEDTWIKKAVCSACCAIVGKWLTCQSRSVELSCDWQERTGSSLPSIRKAATQTFTTKKERLIKCIRNSRYGQFFKEMKELRTAKEGWLLDLTRTIRAEMRLIEKDRSLFRENNSENGSTEFIGNAVLEKIKSRAPTLYTVIFAAMFKSDSTTSLEHMPDMIKTKLGIMFLLPLHHRHPCYHRIPRYLPVRIARTLFARGTSTERRPDSKKLHSTCTVKSSGSGAKMKQSCAPPLTKEQQSKHIVTSWQMAIEEERTSIENGELLAGENMHPGYSLVLDNASRKSKGSDDPVCNAFAVVNRVSFRELQENATARASDLPLNVYLPGQRDYEELRMRMRVLVERILKANLEVFSHQSTLEHIPHQYSKECSLKSTYVNLGTIESQEDPNNLEGMLNILTNLSTLIPDDYDIPLHCDHETIAMVRSARRTASKQSTTENHLHHLLPVPQDLRAVIIQDTMAELFTPTQVSEKGTLRHLKEFFGHNDVDDQLSSFSLTDDFLLFTVCALVVGFAVQILKTSEPARSNPQLGPIADEVVRRIWYQVPMNRVADILNAEVEDHDDKFCFCKQELEEADMIECCNIDCPNGRWFHQNCVMDVEDDGEWFCSPQCEQSNMGQFCICRQKGEEGTELKWTCANESCQRGTHFHSRCVRSSLSVPQGNNWYCSTQCADSGGRESHDELLDYLQRVTWCILFSECILDAEREGDGTASMGYWRISVPEMFARGHDKHVAATHRLLAGTSGCFPPRIREEVIHNRTINLHGGKGKNISLDLSSEHFNSLQEASGKRQKTSQSNQNAGKVSGSIQRFGRYLEDVNKFLDDFGDIFCEMKGRIIPSLCQETVGQEITQEKATAMKKYLLKLNKKFDKEMRVKRHRQYSSD